MTKESLENFWYYNKLKVIAGVIAVIAIIFFIAGTWSNGGEIPHDVEIAYVTDGRTLSGETEEYLNETFASKIEDVTGDQRKETGFVPLQGLKIDLEFVAEGAQVVLMDGNSLRKFISTGILEPLDVYIEKSKLDVSGNPEITAEVDGGESHVYAVPVRCMPLLVNVGYPADDYYFTIRASDKKDKTARARTGNAYAILELALNQQ